MSKSALVICPFILSLSAASRLIATTFTGVPDSLCRLADVLEAVVNLHVEPTAYLTLQLHTTQIAVSAHHRLVMPQGLNTPPPPKTTQGSSSLFA